MSAIEYDYVVMSTANGQPVAVRPTFDEAGAYVVLSMRRTIAGYQSGHLASVADGLYVVPVERPFPGVKP